MKVTRLSRVAAGETKATSQVTHTSHARESDPPKPRSGRRNTPTWNCATHLRKPHSGGRNKATSPLRTPLEITQEKVTRLSHVVAGETQQP